MTYSFKKLVVGIDNTDIDFDLVNAAAFISAVFSSEEVHFVNVSETKHTVERLKEEFQFVEFDKDWGQTQLEGDGESMKKLEKHAEECFHKKKTTVCFKQIDGDPLPELLKYIVDIDADLLFVGKKYKSAGSGVISNKLIRKASCSVIIIPEGFELKVGKVLVPFDFSEHAKIALQIAAYMVQRSKEGRLALLNRFEVPPIHRELKRSEEEFVKMVKMNKVDAINQFIHGLKLEEIKIDFDLEEEIGKVSLAVCDKIKKDDPDWVVMGSKGKTNAHAILLGSVSEKVVQESGQSCVWVVKKKGENISFLNALLADMN